MIRIIKRYESRKLYDTEESRYVSLEDIAKWVRGGQEVKVIDNATSADVSAQILTQIILDEGKRGASFLPTELLHELVRAGEKAVSTGVERVQGKVDRMVQASIDRLGPVRQAREEMSNLRAHLTELEKTLSNLEAASVERKQAAAKKSAAKKPAARKPRSTRKTAAG
jgi:polyhydroxyalkanoate synthesis repressor PhaR